MGHDMQRIPLLAKLQSSQVGKHSIAGKTQQPSHQVHTKGNRNPSRKNSRKRELNIYETTCIFPEVPLHFVGLVSSINDIIMYNLRSVFRFLFQYRRSLVFLFRCLLAERFISLLMLPFLVYSVVEINFSLDQKQTVVSFVVQLAGGNCSPLGVVPQRG